MTDSSPTAEAPRHRPDAEQTRRALPPNSDPGASDPEPDRLSFYLGVVLVCLVVAGLTVLLRSGTVLAPDHIMHLTAD